MLLVAAPAPLAGHEWVEWPSCDRPRMAPRRTGHVRRPRGRRGWRPWQPRHPIRWRRIVRSLQVGQRGGHLRSGLRDGQHPLDWRHCRPARQPRRGLRRHRRGRGAQQHLVRRWRLQDDRRRAELETPGAQGDGAILAHCHPPGESAGGHCRRPGPRLRSEQRARHLPILRRWRDLAADPVRQRDDRRQRRRLRSEGPADRVCRHVRLPASALVLPQRWSRQRAVPVD